MLILNTAYGQIGINTNEPDESAVLEIFSDTKGLLIPRLETSVRHAYGNDNPANGVIVYDIQLSKFFVWRRTGSGIENKGGHWLYINPWYIDETAGTMTLSSSIASSVTIGGTLTVRKDVTMLQNVTINENVDINGSLTSDGNIKVNIPSKFEGYGTIPIGGIIMWSGSIGNIPDGWALCNGSQGTPNLSGRFIVSYGQRSSPPTREESNTSYTIGPGSGLNKYKLYSSESGLPSHNHSASTTGYTKNDGAHIHSVYKGNGSHGGGFDKGDNDESGWYGTNSGSHRHELNASTTINNNTAASASNAHENRPPYYALAFIMRTK